MIRTRQNLFPGVNPHLNSRLQNEGDSWSEFHSAHVIDIGRAIDALLPEGYLVRPEKGLQVRFSALSAADDAPQRAFRRRPDVAVVQSSAQTSPTPSGGAVTAPILSLSAQEILNEGDPYDALVIYAVEPAGVRRSVTWIELLSPNNKRGGSGYESYLSKRALTLKSGIALVEIDYLHQTPPISDRIPSYADDQPGAYPYLVIVSNPRPSLQEGKADVYGAAVSMALPTFPIPLLGDDAVILDLNAVYQQTYRSFAAYSYFVDYDQLPARFKTYSTADQDFIRAHLDEIRAQRSKSAE